MTQLLHSLLLGALLDSVTAVSDVRSTILDVGGPDPKASKVSPQDEAINYMKQWRPKEDGASEEFFRVNADVALKTKDLPYAKQVSNKMFLDYVLPYTHFDEPRDDWRPKMYETLLPFVKDKKNPSGGCRSALSCLGKCIWQAAQLQRQHDTADDGSANTDLNIRLCLVHRHVNLPGRCHAFRWNPRPHRWRH